MRARQYAFLGILVFAGSCKRSHAPSSILPDNSLPGGVVSGSVTDGNVRVGTAQAHCARYQGDLASAASRSAYPTAILQPPNQPWSYIAWVWRETPDVSTVHTLSVARSTDLINWTDTCGTESALPLSLENVEVVDPVAPQGGLLNTEVLSYDSQGRVVISYTKYVALGGKLTSQVFNARRDPDGWKIFQMTHWTTAQNLSGGGSLPTTPLTISFSGLQLDPNGQQYQFFSRATADKTGLPSSGTYAVENDASGAMAIGGAYEPPTLPVTAFAWTPPNATAAAVPDMRATNLATPFEIHLLPSRYQDRWVPLRGDWVANGQDEAGLYDAFSSVFYIWPGGGPARAFPFGSLAATALYQPMVGDWQHTGRDGVGVYSPSLNQSFITNTLSSGAASKVLAGKPSVSQGLVDAPWLWNTWDPSKQYFVRWEALPANRDFPYNCSGQPLSDQNEISVAPTTCPQNFISNLTIWQFNQTTHTWSASVIDQQWGGSAADFDFLTFKNYQIVAYYNASRYLTVATRPLDGAWTLHATDSQFAGWDGHNSITLAVDVNDDIHVSGNMHDVALNYFRSTGLNAGNLSRAPMVGQLEDHVTYPTFMYTPQGTFAFMYRDGVSGDGDTYINVYDVTTKAWKRLLSQPIFSGTSSP